MGIQLTSVDIIAIAICVTIIVGMILWRMKNGLKIKVDKSGIDFDLADKPEKKELQNDEKFNA
jgi:hypothetical protein